MATIFHIAERADWATALAAGGPYEMSTRGRTLADEGFIHCSADLTQVEGVLGRFYSPADDLVLLVIDSTRLTAPLRYEDADGEAFPHLYGPLPLSAVIEVRPLPTTR